MIFNQYPLITSLTPSDTFLVWQQSSAAVKQIANGSLHVVQKVASIAALKAVSTSTLTDGDAIIVEGYYAPSDGGVGIFVYDSASIVADNGGTVIAPNAGTGRWIRQFSGSLNIRWFGAKGDGATDDTDAINNTIAQAKVYGTAGGVGFGLTTSAQVDCPPGRYCVSSIDCTRQVGLLLRSTHGNVVFYADKQLASAAVVDFTGSSGSGMEGIIIGGSTPGGLAPAFIPTVGILIASSIASGDSNKCYFRDCGTIGYFTIAARYIYGATDHYFQNCAWQQSQLDAVNTFIGTTNPYGVASPFQAINVGLATTGDLTMIQDESHGALSALYTAYTTYIYGASAIRYFGGLSDNAGPGHVKFEAATVKNVSYVGTRFYSEAGVPADYVFDSNGASIDGLQVLGCDFDNAGYGISVFNGGGYTKTSVLSSPSAQTGIQGTVTNDNAKAGDIGQSMKAEVTEASGGVPLITATTTDVTSLALTKGDWWVTGVVTLLPAAGTIPASFICGITSTSATFTAGQSAGFILTFPASSNQRITTPTVRVSLAADTTIYLVVNSSFTVSTCNAAGEINALRIR